MHRDERIQQCFAAILRFAEIGADLQVIKIAYATLCGHIDALLQDGPRGSKQGQDGHAIAYAIVALADEMAMKAGSELADFWMPKTLQVRYFEEHAAGDNFFLRLADLRHQATSPVVLSAYYTALALGFEGRYAHDADRAPITALMTQMRTTLLQLTDPQTRNLTVHSNVPHYDGLPTAHHTQASTVLSSWTPLRAWRVLGAACAVAVVFFALSTWYLRSAARPIFELAAQYIGR